MCQMQNRVSVIGLLCAQVKVAPRKRKHTNPCQTVYSFWVRHWLIVTSLASCPFPWYLPRLTKNASAPFEEVTVICLWWRAGVDFMLLLCTPSFTFDCLSCGIQTVHNLIQSERRLHHALLGSLNHLLNTFFFFFISPDPVFCDYAGNVSWCFMVSRK